MTINTLSGCILKRLGTIVETVTLSGIQESLRGGMSGCGWEGWCAFLQIDQDYTIKKFELYQEASCLSNNYVKCKFNPDHPEYGITVEKY